MGNVVGSLKVAFGSAESLVGAWGRCQVRRLSVKCKGALAERQESEIFFFCRSSSVA